MDRGLPLARGLLIAATACAGALLVGAIARFWLEPAGSAGQRTSQRGRAAARPAAPAPLDYAVIFQRNLFGSEPIVVEDPVTRRALGDLVLRGTADFDGLGFAIFEDSASERQGVFQVGDLVFDGPQLVAVEPRLATLLQAGRKIVIELTESTPAASSGGDEPSGQDGAGGIRKVGDNRYAVARAEVDHSIENLSTVVTQMRAVPYLKDGKSVGFRVFNIRSGSLFERMGLQNGDIIQAVNGTDLDDPSRALALLDEVQTADEIRVDLLRNDRPNTLTYSIR